MEEKSLDIREVSELEKSFTMVDNVVTKKYLSQLENMEIVDDWKTIKMLEQHASLFKVQKIVYNRDENNLQKLVNTYASSVGFDSGIALVINSNGKSVELYLGVIDAPEISSARAGAIALCNNFVGNFPGSLAEADEILLDNEPLMALMSKCTQDSFCSVSSVSGVGSIRNDREEDNKNYVQGIEKMIDTMQGIPFSAIFIADTINKIQLDDIKAEYELLYSRLVPFLKSELSFNESSSEGVSKTLSESLSKTLTKSKSTALSVGSSESTAHTEGHAVTNTDTIGVSGGNEVIKASYSHSTSRTENWSDTTTFGTTKTQTSTIGDSEANGEIKSIADGTTKSETTGRGLQITYINKTIQQLLENIDEQLERIKESENYGVFATAAYFLGATPMVTRMAASSYKGLINGNCTHVESAHINSWQDEKSVNCIKTYLRQLQHPVFIYDNLNHITPATIVSGKELAIHMGLPNKSVPGISVIETAAFGRNIDMNISPNRRSINIGNLYHMGKEEESSGGKIPVKIDLDSLTMHTFITGSTGSGKSNAIYSLLEKVTEKNHKNEKDKVTFMVVEPAKGEYKDKFGHLDDVKVYGTNIKKMDLLRINPFSFPEDIHVLEHIDKLVEIFNVCWPMYAAMPAVLKDAIERAYVNAGWDLNESECKYKNVDGDFLYPSFKDVLQQVNIVIDSTQYSADSKGDYKGALCTRIKSLTNGLYGRIFSSDELSQSELFDSNVIIDLSRVGSVETKALIMGLLIIKMQEYRMASRKENNSRLKHITVLEEAHNLLKRTSFEQSSDSSNLLGKSVEMLANSIAEMRTYGEGFVIADQSPGLLDMSVIRNTNTKIILRLPDMSDRELVGKAAALNDNQILELSKLKTGVAAIYQNDWLEPVLCHVYPCSNDQKEYQYCYVKTNDLLVEEIIDYVMLPVPEKSEFRMDVLEKIEKHIFGMPFTSDTKINILRYINEKDVAQIRRLRSKIIHGIFNVETALSLSNTEKHDMNCWYDMMIDKLEPSINKLDEIDRDKILAIIAKEQVEKNGNMENKELFEGLMTLIRERSRR